MNQTKLFILLSILILFSFSSIAQQSNCALKLDEAENLYEMGDLDSIPAMLRSCVNDGFEKILGSGHILWIPFLSTPESGFGVIGTEHLSL